MAADGCVFGITLKRAPPSRRTPRNIRRRLLSLQIWLANQFGDVRPTHSGWKFAALRSLALRSRSSAMNLANACGVSADGSMPSAARRPSVPNSFTASLTQPLMV